LHTGARVSFKGFIKDNLKLGWLEARETQSAADTSSR
jgi:hypothetical protein